MSIKPFTIKNKTIMNKNIDPETGDFRGKAENYASLRLFLYRKIAGSPPVWKNTTLQSFLK